MCPLASSKPGGLVIEEQHPQQQAGGIEQMHRDNADRAVPLCSWASGVEGEGKWRGVAAMAVLANDAAVTPRCDQQRAGACRVG
jgi:hypothetical protein